MPSSLSHRLSSKESIASFNRFGDARFIHAIAWGVLAIVCALVIGTFVGQARWNILIAIAALPLAVWWPVQTALGVFALVVPFDAIAVAGQAGDNGITLTFFAGAGATFILLAAGLISRRIHLPPRSALWWSLFVFWSGLTYLWAIDPDSARGRLPTAGALLLLYLITSSFRLTPAERRWIVLLAVLGGCFGAVYVLKEFSQGVTFAGANRASLVVGEQAADPNGMAAGLLLPISMAMALFFSSQKRIGKVLAMLAVATIGFCIFMTMSRGALLALIVIAVVYLLRLKKWRALIPVAALLLLLVFVPESFFSRVEKAGSSGGAGRIPIWIAGLEALKHYWVLGTGVDGFPAAYTEYVGFAPEFNGFGRAPHNLYLGTWVELGIVGMAFLFLAIKSQFRAIRHTSANFDPILVGAEAACWALLVAGFFLDVLWRKYFWFAWILLAISTQIQQEPSSRIHENAGLKKTTLC